MKVLKVAQVKRRPARKKVIVEGGTAQVCQKCLVKWAHQWSGVLKVCNMCHRRLRESQ
jgi:hypothetical protein